MKSFEVTFFSSNKPGAIAVRVDHLFAEDEFAAPGVAQTMLIEQKQPLPVSLRNMWTVRWLGFGS